MVQPSRVYNEPESRLVMVEISPCYHCLPSDPAWPHLARPDESCPGKISQMMMDDEDCWGGGSPLIILILSFDWVTVLTFGSSPVQSPVLVWFCPGDIFMNIEIISTIPLRTFLGPERKYSLFTAGPDSGWCCISSFHLLFKSLLNIPRGPRTARISLH